MPKRNQEHHHHHHHHFHWGREKHRRYAHHAGDPSPGPNRHWLYRNTRDGMIAGVCAGVADYFGWPVRYVRLSYILAVVFFPPFPLFFYFAAALFLRPGEPIANRYSNAAEEQFWRRYSARPKATFSDLKHRFRALDARVADMERVVTSNEFSLRRKFDDLERGVSN